MPVPSKKRHIQVTLTTQLPVTTLATPDPVETFTESLQRCKLAPLQCYGAAQPLLAAELRHQDKEATRVLVYSHLFDSECIQ